jgi:hypothetical protein
VKVLLSCKHVDAAVIGYGYLPSLSGTHTPHTPASPTAPLLASTGAAAHPRSPAAAPTSPEKAQPVAANSLQPASLPALAALSKVASSTADALFEKAVLPATGAAAAVRVQATVAAAVSGASAASGFFAGLACDALAARASVQLSGRSGSREGSEAVLQLPDSCLAGCAGSPPPASVDLVACLPMQLAAGLGNVDALRMLLEHSAAGAAQAAPRLDPDMSLLCMFVLQAPLHHAVQSGSLECVKFLLEHGHFVDEETAQLSRTPLHLAAQLGRLHMVQLLLENGVSSRCSCVP